MALVRAGIVMLGAFLAKFMPEPNVITLEVTFVLEMLQPGKQSLSFLLFIFNVRKFSF